MLLTARSESPGQSEHDLLASQLRLVLVIDIELVEVRHLALVDGLDMLALFVDCVLHLAVLF